MIGLDVILAKPDGKTSGGGAATEDAKGEGGDAARENGEAWMAALAAAEGEADPSVEAVLDETALIVPDLDAAVAPEVEVEAEVAPEVEVAEPPLAGDDIDLAAPVDEAPVPSPDTPEPGFDVVEVAPKVGAEQAPPERPLAAAPALTDLGDQAPATPAPTAKGAGAQGPAAAATDPVPPQTATLDPRAVAADAAPKEAAAPPAPADARQAQSAPAAAAAQAPPATPAPLVASAPVRQAQTVEAEPAADKPTAEAEETLLPPERRSYEGMAEVRRGYAAAALSPVDRMPAATAQPVLNTPDIAAFDDAALDPGAERLEAPAATRAASSVEARAALLTPPPGSPQAQAQAASIIAQIRVGFAASDGGRIDIRLDPPELGRLSVTILARDDLSIATVSAERAEVVDLLRRQGDMLARELAEAGFENLSLDFAAQDDGAGSDGEPISDAFDFVGTEPSDGAAGRPARVITDRLDIRL